MNTLELGWLPEVADWREQVRQVGHQTSSLDKWRALIALARTRLDLARTARVDALRREFFPYGPPEGLGTRPIRLALLGSSTLAHLHAAIRIGALRRGIWVDLYEPDYGQYLQELADMGSGLRAFRPDTVLFAIDSRHVSLRSLGGDPASDGSTKVTKSLEWLSGLWQMAREAFGCSVVQQTFLPIFPPLLGSNDVRYEASPAALIDQLNAGLRHASATRAIDLLDAEAFARVDGVAAWHDPSLWAHSKQEVNPLAAPFYGDLVGRLLAAQQGLSYKCLALDLDNTLWGGVIGDDGLEGIVLGQGSALGEGFLALQAYALALAKRGIILAVVSKNNEEVAKSAFERHPEMLLRSEHIACFIANWEDKPGNLRRVAEELNIGLDSIVFVDDNPFERDFVRRELPVVAVPEVPEDPAFVSQILAYAGYFESLGVTDEDLTRTRQYSANRERAASLTLATDVDAYLRSLKMKLVCKPFDRVAFQRVHQLINKTNQFNLTTQRYSEHDVETVMADPGAVHLQIRLIDRFGDNGIIAILIGRSAADACGAGARPLDIETWLMSCRVLGRHVEEATLNALAGAASERGYTHLLGRYVPSSKNQMVRDHYTKLGFTPTGRSGEFVLALNEFQPHTIPMALTAE